MCKKYIHTIININNIFNIKLLLLWIRQVCLMKSLLTGKMQVLFGLSLGMN